MPRTHITEGLYYEALDQYEEDELRYVVADLPRRVLRERSRGNEALAKHDERCIAAIEAELARRNA